MQSIYNSQQETQYAFASHSGAGVTFPLTKTNAAVFLDHVITLHQQAGPCERTLEKDSSPVFLCL